MTKWILQAEYKSKRIYRLEGQNPPPKELVLPVDINSGSVQFYSEDNHPMPILDFQRNNYNPFAP